MTRPAGLRGLAWPMIALTLSGCSSWQATKLPPPAPAAPGDTAQAAVAKPMPDQLRLRLVDGTEVTLDQPRVDGDSLRGINVPMLADQQALFGPHKPRLGHVPRTIALSDIKEIKSKRFDGVNTLILFVAVGGLIYLGGLVAYAISLNGSD